MNILKRALSRVGLQMKHSAVGSLLSLMNLGRPLWSPRRYDKFAEEGYQKNVIAFASIRMVSTSAASVPWLLYHRRGGKRRELTEHPLLTLLKRPSPMQAGPAFMASVYGYYMLAGNSYIEAVGPDRRPPRELYPQRPDRIQIIPGRFGLPQGYVYKVSGQEKVWEVDAISGLSPVLHMKTFNPLNDWYGMSPIEAAAYAIDTHNQAGAWNKALLDNSARPSGALIAKTGLMKEQFERLKLEIEDQYVGAKNAGRPLLLEELEWQEMGLSPKDMDYIKSKHTSARDIALAFGTPPMLLGIPGDNTYSNYQEARLALYEETVLPLVGFTCGEFNNWLVPQFGEDLELGYDEDSISALEPRREKKWKKAQESDFLTINEKRLSVGYDEVPEGDVVLVSASMLPLGFAISGDEGGDKSFNADEYKLVNDNSPKKRAHEWSIQMRLMAGFESALTFKMAKLLDRQARKAAKAFESAGRQGALLNKDHIDETGTVLRAHYNALMPVFGYRVLDGFKSMGPHETKEPLLSLTKDVEDLFEKFFAKWIAKFTARKVAYITSETRSLIVEAIEAGEEEGESVAKIASRIREKVGGDFAKRRAGIIARTETHSAATAANDFAAASTGLDLKRSWLSARSATTRETHAAVDGQVRGMDDPFDVGGYKLLRPGDPNGPPQEIINCRCVVTYITQET